MWRLGQDVKFAFRMAAQNPWLTVAAVFALGAGMSVTIIGFSVSWSAHFASLPFPDADRIVAVRDIGVPDPDDVPPALPVFREWEERQGSFERIAAYYRRGRDVLDGEGGFVRQYVAVMTASGFDVPRVAPLMGRTLRRDDEEPGAPSVVVIGYQAWRSLLGGSHERLQLGANGILEDEQSEYDQ